MNAIPCEARNDELSSKNLLLSLYQYFIQSFDRNFNYLMLVELLQRIYIISNRKFLSGISNKFVQFKFSSIAHVVSAGKFGFIQ